MAKRIGVKVQGITFNSLKDACEYLKIKYTGGLAHALSKGNTKYKGMEIEQVPVASKRKNRKGKGGCPVICENLNVTFKTISEAAQYAQADGWTMSKKMQSSGKFIDQNGNVYKRMLPMKSKNVYSDTGASLTKIVPFIPRPGKRKVKEDKQEKMVFEQPAQVTTPKVEQPVAVNKVDAARAVLKQKAMNYIQNDKYSIAKDFLDVIAALGE